MPWKKGTSGNPSGNPGKDKFLRTALLMELKSKGQDMPELRAIARRIIDCAVKGKESWSWAAKEIWDRLDGKAVVAVMEDSQVRDARDLSDEELNALIVQGLTDDELEALIIARRQAATP